MDENTTMNPAFAPEQQPHQEPAAPDQEQQENTTNPAQDEIEQLKADIAKRKEALVRAMKESEKYKRQLQEIAAREEEPDETAEEIEELSNKIEIMKLTTKITGKFGVDERDAMVIARALKGAKDPEKFLDEVQAVFDDKLRSMRREFSRVPAPGVGAVITETYEAPGVALARQIAREHKEREKPVPNAYIQ